MNLRRGRPGTTRRRTSWAGGFGIAAIVALPLGSLAASLSANGGDPGGVILHELLATSSAIPRDSHPSTYIAAEPRWIGSCSDVYLRKGWSEAQGVTSFESALPVARVEAYVSQHLDLAGWKAEAPIRPGEWYVNGAQAVTYITRWTKVLPQHTEASITLQTSIPVHRRGGGGPSTWLLGGSAEPEPPVGFCGGG